MLRDAIIGIDRGASYTDLGLIAGGRLVEFESLKGRDWAGIERVFTRLAAAHGTEQVVFTGSAAGMPAAIRERIVIIPEIDAIGFGGSAMAGHSDCLVVSAGTGTAVVHFRDGAAKHVGGTGVGGGTVTGLGMLICGSDDPRRLEALALEGNASALNLTLTDLGYEGLSFLGGDVTASNFAAPRSRRVEDLAAAVLSLVAETIGIIASLCAREAACRDRIVMVGKVSENRFIRRVLDQVGTLYQTVFTYPEHPGYATVFGAAMSYRNRAGN